MTEVEDTYTQACMQIQRDIDAFKQNSSIDTYLQAKEQVIKAYLATFHPGIVVKMERERSTQRTQDYLHINFTVGMVLNCSSEDGQQITQELCAYLDHLSSIEASPVCQTVGEPR
jgi:hypothetical protein